MQPSAPAVTKVLRGWKPTALIGKMSAFSRWHLNANDFGLGEPGGTV
jgi:hypothetical protein